MILLKNGFFILREMTREEVVDAMKLVLAHNEYMILKSV